MKIKILRLQIIVEFKVIPEERRDLGSIKNLSLRKTDPKNWKREQFLCMGGQLTLKSMSECLGKQFRFLQLELPIGR